MSTSSYENGYRDGWWTPERVRACSFGSAQECLVHQERLHQDEVAALSHLQKPAYAAQHAEYLEGWIAATRRSLGEMG